MAKSLLDRLRAVLARQYEIERELGSGGMGIVYLARDVTLERRVAIKILRPEHATAASAERFLREARIVAKLSHPNVVAVHSAGEVDGLFYYVMDYVEGETLADRLRRGPLSGDELVTVGDELLRALETAHDSGVIHRDIKPSNIFVIGERVLLGDFGIAKPLDEGSESLTSPGAQVGTPAYMPPEQIGGEVTPQTDLYALGMVLYEAASGERWSILTSVDEADWSRVPRRLSRILRRALAWSPAERYASASEFRQELTARRRKSRQLPWAVRGAAAVVAVAVAGWAVYELLIRQPVTAPPGESDLVILPVQDVRGDEAAIDGEDLAILVGRKLERMGVSIVPERRCLPWWEAAKAAGISVAPERDAASELSAQYAAFATIHSSGGRVWAELDVFDARGNSLPVLRQINFARGDREEVADSITLKLAQIVLEDELVDSIPRLTRDREALTQFVLGEKAFERGQWSRAVEYYRVAVERDSSFVQAWWHMANAWRWMEDPGPYPADYRRLFDQYASKLPAVDSMLMAAQLGPAGPARIAGYREAHRRYPQNDFAAFLYGEELFNRGALWGEPLDSAVHVLRTAVALSPSWASALMNLYWANIRLGRADDARVNLERLLEIIVDSDEEGWYLDPALLRLAYASRFQPEAAAASFPQALQDPRFESPETVARLARLGNAFDAPATQLMLGQWLAAAAPEIGQLRAAGHIAQGLSLMTLGRASESLAHFDSVAAITGEREALLQAAQWRVLPHVLGLPAPDSLGLGFGRQVLERLVDDEALGARAAWTLAMDAYGGGDVRRGRDWSARFERLGTGEGAERLAILLAAMDSAVHERFQAALDRAQVLLEHQAVTVPLRGAPGARTSLGDPFARAALHLKRGEWFLRLGDLDRARREYIWHDAVDVDGLPSVELPQPGEIDWAMGTFGHFKLGQAALEMNDLEMACRHFNRAVGLWANVVDPGYVELRAQAVYGSERACS